MITKIRITGIDADRNEEAKVQGFDVRFSLDKVEVVKDEIRVKFGYETAYKGGAGHIKLKGDLVAREDKETTKKIEDELKAGKLPAEYMQKVVNAVNYFGTTNATIIASVINIVPPIKMPNLQFKQQDKKEKAK